MSLASIKTDLLCNYMIRYFTILYTSAGNMMIILRTTFFIFDPSTWLWSKLSFETMRLSDRSDFNFSGIVVDKNLSRDSAIDLNLSYPRISSWKIFKFLHLMTKDPSMCPFPLVWLLPPSVPDWFIRSIASIPVCNICNFEKVYIIYNT